MRKLSCFAIVCLVWLAGSLVRAGSEIPNLLGAWHGQCETGAVIRGDKPSPITHRDKEFNVGECELVLTKQKGRIVRGDYRSKRATEQIVGVIGFDNKTWYLVDEDGIAGGRILSPDKMDLIYLHAKTSDSVAGAVIFTRKKKQK